VDPAALGFVIDATQMLTPAGEGSLLPVRTSTGFADDIDFISVPRRRLYLVPISFLEQRDRHFLGDHTTSTRFEIVDLASIL
jgi:hypothetical protein